ncbi:Elongation of fatty acids protein 2 [Mortierella sp. GBA30]|nr:Elongation of fatty acids protein 2 [Mortierella sp. GBA30]
MGVKGLTALLQKLAPEAVSRKQISHYRGKTVAVDVSCFLNRFIYGLDPHPARVQRGVYKLCMYLKLHGIRPIFVFDGPDRIIEKQRETQRREALKTKVEKSFRLEKARKSRLRELKGSAQLLRTVPPETVSSILKDIRLQDDSLTTITTPVSTSKNLSVSTSISVPVSTPISELAAKSIDRDTEKLTPQSDGRPFLSPSDTKATDQQKMTPSVTTKDNLLRILELDSLEARMLLEHDQGLSDDSFIWDSHPVSEDDGLAQLERHLQLSKNFFDDGVPLVETAGVIDQDDQEEMDLFERELDTLDRLELDLETVGNLDIIQDLSDNNIPSAVITTGNNLPLILRTGTSVEVVIGASELDQMVKEDPSDPYFDTRVRQKVHAALEKFVKSAESREQVDPELLAAMTTQRQKALNELEQKLVQEIKQTSRVNARLRAKNESNLTIEDSEPLGKATFLSPRPEQIVEKKEPYQLSSISLMATAPDSQVELPLMQDSEVPGETQVEAVVANQNETERDSGDSEAIQIKEVAEKIGDDAFVEDGILDAGIPMDKEDSKADEIVKTEELDMKSMIFGVLSAHQSIFNTLERRTMRVTRPLVLSCQALLKAMGEPVIEAREAEAESVCAYLTAIGVTDASVSEDTDTAVFGNGLLLRQVAAGGEKDILEIDPLKAQAALGLSRDAFRDFCILCGTDFSGTIEGIGPLRAVQLMQYYGSIESIMANVSNKPRPDFLYDQARRVFDRKPILPQDPAAFQPKSEKRSLLLELLQKYEIDADQVKVDILSEGITTDQADTGFGSTWTTNSMGEDPFKS